MFAGEQLELTLRALADEADRDAWGSLYLEYRDVVHLWARDVLEDAEEAEDIVHDVFLALPLLLQRFTFRQRDSTGFRAWLRQVTRRAALMKRRAGLRRRNREQIAGVAEELRDPSDSLAMLVEAEAALSGLSSVSRAAFVLTEVEGRSHREAAAALGMDPAACRKRVSRVRTVLRQALPKDEQSRP